MKTLGAKSLLGFTFGISEYLHMHDETAQGWDLSWNMKFIYNPDTLHERLRATVYSICKSLAEETKSHNSFPTCGVMLVLTNLGTLNFPIRVLSTCSSNTRWKKLEVLNYHEATQRIYFTDCQIQQREVLSYSTCPGDSPIHPFYRVSFQGSRVQECIRLHPA